MTTLMPSATSSRRYPPALPRYATPRTPSRPTVGPQVAKIAELLGQPLMPWQRQVADVAGEFEFDEEFGLWLPAYREVDVTVPRQNGKTTWVLAEEIHRSVSWRPQLIVPKLHQLWRPELVTPEHPELIVPALIVPQNVIYTAQTGLDARTKLLEDQAPLVERSPLKALVELTNRGEVAHKAAGHEKISWRTGSKIMLQASTDAAGHGKTADLGIIDEAFADVDGYREGAIMPAQFTKAEAQLFVISTAGTDKSAYLNRKVDAGRAGVVNGRTRGTAYFEWSAPDDADPTDPATWWSCNPALGHIITQATIQHAFDEWWGTDDEHLFLRTVLNRRTKDEEPRVIPEDFWDTVCAGDVRPEGKLAIAIDVHPERISAAIAVADTEGRAELVEHRPGTSWVVPRAVEMAKRWDADVALDGRGPAGSLTGEIEAQYVTVHEFSPEKMAEACANVYDAIADAADRNTTPRLRVRRRTDLPGLDAAVAAVRKQYRGDVWVWGRKDPSTDVCPLFAVTIAYVRGQELGREGDLWIS